MRVPPLAPFKGVSATTYYIDPSGKNTNNGSSSSPWNTLAYACSKVTTQGDIIHVNAGTYIETSQSELAVGVSIEGVGVTSIIKSHITSADWKIQLLSSSEGTNGNQHISNIKGHQMSLMDFMFIIMSLLATKGLPILTGVFKYPKEELYQMSA